MARRQGQPVHGWVNLDKPKGVSSAKAVAIVRRVFNAAKAGHGGTLDPLASGILPIALGEATKTVSFAMDRPKAINSRWLGAETSTDDVEGEVTHQSDKRPVDTEIDLRCSDLLVKLIRCHQSIRLSRLMGGRLMTLRARRHHLMVCQL